MRSGVTPRSRLILVLLACLRCGCAPPCRAAQPPPGGGVIEGFVTTQSGTIRLGGAQVVLHNSSNQEVATVLSDGDGRFRFTALQEGQIHADRVARRFRAWRAPRSSCRRRRARPNARSTCRSPPLTQTVEVMAPASIVSAADTLGSAESINSHETDEFANGTGLGGALRLLASVIEVPGRRQHQGRDGRRRPACRSARAR